MNIYDWYITPEEYKIAKNNGISKENLEQRIRRYGWNKEKALETPIKKRNKISKKFKDMCKKNNITIGTFYSRVYGQEWDMEKAATEPIMDMKTKSVNFTNRLRKYPIEWIEKAKTNGISDYNFRRRVREYGWDYERAATTPVKEVHNA
jgi:transcriptional regulator with AAA-type ATPase domain